LIEGVQQRRLLVISFHHPPDGAIGGLRWAGLTKYLAPLGWKSWIITAAPLAGTPQNGSPVVVSCPRRTTFNDLYRSLRIRNGASASGAESGDVTSHRSRAFARLRLEVGMLLSLPDQGRGWILRAARAARRLITQVAPDAVVSTGPPHSAHLVAWLALRGRPTRWLVDLRDPWAGPITNAWRASPWEQSALARSVTERAERLVMGAASGLLCNTSQFAEAMQARYPGVPIHWIPNAVDHELLPRAEEAIELFPGLGLAYAGTLYAGRDLRPILHAMRVFLDRHPQGGVDACRLRIAGHIEGPHGAELRRAIDEFRLHEHVELLGVLSRDAALRLAARSRLGVVLAQEQELQVPAKLYELAGMGVPTVVIAATRSAAWTEAHRVGAMPVEPEDTDSLVRVMERVGNGGPPPHQLDYRDLALRIDALLAPSLSGAPV
jgi:glycosyltransferase involved in cell wall biosynthesis